MRTHRAVDNDTFLDSARTTRPHGVANHQLSSPQPPDFKIAEVWPAERTNPRQVHATSDMRFDSPKSKTPCYDEGLSGITARSTSGSLVKENRCGVAQSFLESALHKAPYIDHVNHEIANPAADADPCTCCCRCGRIREWKPTGLRAKRKSRSYSPIRTGVSELSGWLLEPPSHHESVDISAPSVNPPGGSPIERLPVELLDHIIAQLALDIPPAEYTPRNVDLVSCLLTSHTLNAVTTSILYNHVTIPHSFIFSKFLAHISQWPSLGKITKRLDLSHFTSLGLGRTKQLNSDIQNLTSKTLLRCLDLTPAIQEVLLQEHLEDDIDEAVLRKLFFGIRNLRAIDFCASSSQSFVEAFSATLSSPLDSGNSVINIRRLSLHECFTLPSSSLESLLPRLPRLTHLDVCHTRISDKALTSIPKSAKLTHLNLGRCTQISGDCVVNFLTTHPAASGLICLSLSCDVSRYRLLWETDVERLLPFLPVTLRSLNLSGAKIRPSHRSLLLPLTKHLEELGIGYAELSMQDISSFFLPQPSSNNNSGITDEELTWTPSSLRYLDLTGISTVTKASLFNSSCNLLNLATYPLEVLELGDKAISALRDCGTTNKRLGWVVKELGRRGWYVREPTTTTCKDVQSGTTRGKRDWKMGAVWWGSRKIPVAYMEVGGLLGHYMFKK